MGLSGLPIIYRLSKYRESLHQGSNGKISRSEKVGNWLGHKAVTCISIPLNVLEIVGCVVLGVISACTLGAIKVAVFALSLENYKPGFTIGVAWLGERALHGFVDTYLNIIELVHDAKIVFNKTKQFVKWSAEKLHVTDLFNRISKKISFIVNQVIGHLKETVDVTWEAEPYKAFEAPYPFKELNEWTKSTSIDLKSDDRALLDVFKHYLLSVANIPVNFAATLALGSISVVSTALFLSKVGLYAAFKVKVPLPTYLQQFSVATFQTAGNTIRDFSNDIADIVVLSYKASNTLGIIRVAKTALKVVVYIPESIFA